MKVRTHLLSGAGNTFHVTYGAPPADEGFRIKIALNICAKQPADGFIFLQSHAAGYKWEFYNSDGSRAEMCGNATRCIGFYLKNILKKNENSWVLETTAGPIDIQSISAEMFKIVMTPLKLLQSDLGFFVDTGVPHLVVERANFSNLDEMRDSAKKLRGHSQFQPKGTNVTFVSLKENPAEVKAISFERGVEDFTQACGTGAAAAAAYNFKFRGALQTEVEMPGGTLIMNLTEFQSPIMVGPAVLLGSYEYEISA